VLTSQGGTASGDGAAEFVVADGEVFALHGIPSAVAIKLVVAEPAREATPAVFALRSLIKLAR
jgi:hypothetical protein